MKQKMKIVVLDGYGTNPGDISWAPLAALGDLEVYDFSTPEEALVRAKDADAVISCRVPITRKMLPLLPNLKYIGMLATGYNIMDLAAAAERGIPVCNVPIYCLETVSQFAVSLMLALCNRVESHSALVKQNKWAESVDKCFGEWKFMEVSGKTLGLYGYGNIARKVGAIARAMGMKVLAYRRHPSEEEGVTFVSKEELLRESDIISIHCPLTEETRHSINADALALMKPTAFLINTARGAVIEEEAVAQALHAGKLGGYAGDVFETEPDLEHSPLRTAPNTVLTPHIAWGSQEARQRLINEVARNLEYFQLGTVHNRVN